MDMDPAIFDAPYYDEIVIDGQIRALAPLLTLYDGVIAYAEEKCQQEELAARQSTQRPHLVLYVRRSCPYCTKVIKYLQKEGKTIAIKDIGKSDEAKQELIKIGGKKQVPCLVINGRPMYESSDILHWLKTHKSQYS